MLRESGAGHTKVLTTIVLEISCQPGDFPPCGDRPLKVPWQRWYRVHSPEYSKLVGYSETYGPY
jgi:hypothetical protein